jgi:hypothetical protein
MDSGCAVHTEKFVDFDAALALKRLNQTHTSDGNWTEWKALA